MKPYQLSLGGLVVSTLLLLIHSSCTILFLWETSRPSMWFLIGSNLFSLSMAVMLYGGRPGAQTAKDKTRETEWNGKTHTTTMSPNLEEAYHRDFLHFLEEIEGLEEQIANLQRALQKSRKRHGKATDMVKTLMEVIRCK